MDADVSTGEVNDGEYLVFLEIQRKADIVDKITEMLEDLQHLTNVKPNRWKFKWYKQNDYVDLSPEALRETLPTTPQKYNEYVESYKTVQEKARGLLPDIADLKRLSGIK